LRAPTGGETPAIRPLPTGSGGHPGDPLLLPRAAGGDHGCPGSRRRFSINQGGPTMATHTREDVLSWRGRDLYGNDGDKIGTIDDIYLDRETEEPEWAVVTTGLFGTKRTFVPLSDAQMSEDGLRVPFEKATVKDAPRIDPDGELSHEEERTLYSHYGRQYQDYDAGSGLLDTSTRTDTDVDTTTADRRGGPGTDVSGPNTDDAMTRSEEELHVGTTEREAGRVRLKKYVVEDQVTETVPVRREEVRLEREPITGANVDDALDGPAISEEVHEVTLHAEEPVVEKRAVPKERVRLQKDVETEQREVTDTVRSERIDVDDDRR
jgi:uncharacterized protein (TIGR02271 family)